MRVIAVDTSSELGSVACVVDGVLRSAAEARVRARHGETVFSLLEQVMAHADFPKSEIELVSCGLGPGSFTGTRVGVAAAKALALALDVPLVGVSTLVALARAAPGQWLAPVVDANRGEVFVAVYERGPGGLEERLAPTHGPPLELLSRLGRFPALTIFGTGARRYSEVLPPSLPALFDSPRAAVIALEAVERLAARGPDDRATLEPVYLRPSDAKLPDVPLPTPSP